MNHPSPTPAGAGPAAAMVYQGMLPMNRCLTPGDYIVSLNGMFTARLDAGGRLRVERGQAGASPAALWASDARAAGGPCFALVQSDGNFCIYQGSDLAHNQGWHWGTQMTAGGGQFHAQLRNDGEFCICAGAGLHDAGEVVWRSGATDPVIRIDAIHAIDYHLADAETGLSQPASLYRETVQNAGDQKQTSNISGSVSVGDSASWSDRLAINVGVSASFSGPVPVMSGRKVTMSADSGHHFLRNGGTTAARNWGFNAPAAVPPNSAMTCVVAAVRSTVIVPYTLSGSFTLASGTRVDGTVAGTFTGTNCHDLSVTLSVAEPASAAGATFNRALVPVSN